MKNMKTIADVEKDYGMIFDDVKNKRMKLSTWFRRQGLSSGASVLEKLESLNNYFQQYERRKTNSNTK